MATTYESLLTTDAGLVIADLSSFIHLECSRVANEIGSFAQTMPLSFNRKLISPDRMIQIWRTPEGGSRKLWRIYFLRRWKYRTIGGNRGVVLMGPCVNDLLRRRIVAAYAGSSQAGKTDFADDMIKEVVSESVLNTAQPTPDAGTRAWANLSVENQFGLGPTITKEFAFGRLLELSGGGVLPEIVQAAKETDGTNVFFDIVPDVISQSSVTFKLKTYINQIGMDVSDKVIFSNDSGNLNDPELEYDYSEEENYIYSEGKGNDSDRNDQQVYDATRYGMSIWNRCEGYADARNQDTDNGVIAAGNSQLYRGRPKVRFTGKPVSTKGIEFGKHWNFGDAVAAKYEDIALKFLVNAMTLVVDDNGEDIRTRFDYEGLL